MIRFLILLAIVAAVALVYGLPAWVVYLAGVAFAVLVIVGDSK